MYSRFRKLIQDFETVINGTHTIKIVKRILIRKLKRYKNKFA